ncbi:MAG: DUF4105 domain-containing protein [Planctomycetaceae bacterium]|nr:DUF4105 domain-containing protein [Planctomycetaceae bacterium]
MATTLFACALVLASIAIVHWTAGAIYYDVFYGGYKGAFFAATWITFWLVALTLWRPLWAPFVLQVVAFVVLCSWWRTLRPSQSRRWDPYFFRTARISMNRDVVTIENLRNSDYYGIGDGLPRYETRTYHLSRLCGVDALIVTWGSQCMSHPMFVFNFGAEGRVCISIEVRYREGQTFSFLRSLYRQQELMYVVCDERDAILRRTRFLSGHDLYLYRLQVDDIASRQFFLEFATSVNSLAEEPRWYHGLTTNCTTSVYAQGRGHIRWEWRMLFNGSLDRLLYDRCLLDQRLPFADLKKLSWINDIANEASRDGFGDFLRKRLPGYALAQTTAPTVEKVEPS